ncbi:ESPR-type extended signal peptide-containing protein [Burkholderia anthina]|uniref:ESPR-type extended signal peptide-containing protein n=1 Tax=Burkholderia anthina TaxID=179879 RepID=UPI0009BF1AD5|nr:ESPR-type extended signal peptide-containing protein [Burkholderia anthina]
MNKKCYRVVFNRVRGVMIAVQENGSSPRAVGNKGVSAPSGLAELRIVWQPIAMAAALLFGVPLFSFAQIAPTPGTSTHVIQTQNGIPQVNIAAPSGAGVSVNTYNRWVLTVRSFLARRFGRAMARSESTWKIRIRVNVRAKYTIRIIRGISICTIRIRTRSRVRQTQLTRC